MTMKTQWYKTYGMQQSNFKREVYSNTTLPQETGKISNTQPNFTPKAIREWRAKRTQSEQKETNHKDQIRNKLKRNEGNNSKDQ